MKKGWKIFWIITGCVAALGLVLCGVAAALGFSFAQIREHYPNGIGFIRSYDVSNQDDDTRDSHHVSERGYAHSFSGVTELQLRLYACDVYIEESDDDSVHVDTESMNLGSSGIEVNVSENAGKLTLEMTKNGKVWDNIAGTKRYGELYIYLPKDIVLDNVDVNFGVGTLTINDLHTDRLNMNVGAGECDVFELHANEVTVNVGAGELQMTGEIESELNVKCGAGEADFYLAHSRTDYNYTLKCGIGEIKIADEKFGGISSNHNIGNGADRDIDISCGVGTVSVEFGY